MQKFVAGFTERKSSNKRKQIFSHIFVVLRFEKTYQRDVFRFNSFRTFRETTSCEPVNNNFVRYFDGRKLLLRPLLSRNLSQSTYVLEISATIVAAF